MASIKTLTVGNTTYDIESGIVGSAQSDLVKDTVGWTGKNLAPNNVSSSSQNGITFTVNSDGSVTANGTATANAFFELTRFNVVAGDYILSQGVITGSPDTRLQLSDGSSAIAMIQSGDSVNVTINENKRVYIVIRIASGYTANNLVFKPMLRKADISDATFEPYHESVDVAKVGNDLFKDTIGWSSKNAFDYHKQFSIAQGTTLTANADGSSIEVSNSTAGTYKMVTFRLNVEPNTDYVVTSDVVHVSGTGYIAISTIDSDTEIKASGVITANTKIAMNFNSGNNTSLRLKLLCTWSTSTTGDMKYNNTLVRKASIADDTYEPYHASVEQTLRDAEVIEGKNLLPNDNAAGFTKTMGGITFTVNADKSITVNGTRSDTAYIALTGENAQKQVLSVLGNIVFKAGKTIKNLTTSSSGVGIAFRDVDGGFQGIGAGSTYTFTKDVSVVYLEVTSGTFSNQIIYPMLVESSETDPTYEPYYRTIHQQLRDYELVQGKNKLQVSDSLVNTTTGGITYTINRNSNGEVTSIVANGTASGTSSIDVAVINMTDCILCGCPSGGSNSAYKVQYIDIDHTGNQYNDFGSGVTIPSTLPSVGRWTVRVVIYNGTVCNNLTFKPMFVSADESRDFEPYYIPLKDAMLPRAEQVVLGAKNLWDLDNSFSPSESGSYTVNSGTLTINMTATQNSGIWMSGSQVLNPRYANYVGIRGGLSFDYKGDASFSAKMGYYAVSDQTQKSYSVTTNWQHYESYDIADLSVWAGSILFYNVSGASHTLQVKNIMLRLASDPDDTYAPYAMTNKELTDEVKRIEKYFEQTKTNVPTTSDVTFTFTDSSISDNSAIDVYSSIYGYNPKDVSTSGTTCTVVFPAPDSTIASLKCRIYVK